MTTTNRTTRTGDALPDFHSDEAELLKPDQTLIIVSPDEYDALKAAFDRPGKPNSRLKALIRRTPPWE